MMQLLLAEYAEIKFPQNGNYEDNADYKWKISAPLGSVSQSFYLTMALLTAKAKAMKLSFFTKPEENET